MRGILTPPNDGDLLQARGGFFVPIALAVFLAQINLAGVAYLAVANIFTQPQTINPATVVVNNLLTLMSSIADFLQVEIKNTSTGIGAQSGFSATADTGTLFDLFIWLGINNSGQALVAQYNIGGPLDTSLLSAAGDLYIANSKPAKDIIMATGTGTAASRTPWFNERIRISQARDAVTISGPLIHAPVGQVPGGMIGVPG